MEQLKGSHAANTHAHAFDTFLPVTHDNHAGWREIFFVVKQTLDLRLNYSGKFSLNLLELVKLTKRKKERKILLDLASP